MKSIKPTSTKNIQFKNICFFLRIPHKMPFIQANIKILISHKSKKIPQLSR